MNLNINKKFSYYWIILLCFSLFFCAKANDTTPIPSSCQQMILVLTDSINTSTGTLFYFERDKANAEWILSNEKIPVVIGHNGLGWGNGLHHDSTNIFNYPIKQEGDGKSPAGIFNLSFVFGYKPEDQMLDLKMPYVHITEIIECVDDVNSKYYNQVVMRDKIETERIDWESSEEMYFYDIYYELGVFVDHNLNPIKKKYGSCVFLHNCTSLNGPTAGCTGMYPSNMEDIVYWLDEAKHPVLVQLTKRAYIYLIKQWELPEILEIEK